MNKQESDVMNALMRGSYISQRVLAEECGHSLGVVNRSIKNLMQCGYLDEDMQPTEMAISEWKEKAPRNAVILAAGFGMRMVPINTETSKGLLKVKGEPLIERTIRQLHEAGITEIYIVVGFMKEQYEYLMDKYGVELIVNASYAVKNNLHSLELALPHLSNTYIIPCDIWCEHNPFSRQELYSWYMVSDMVDAESTVRVNRKMELVAAPKDAGGNVMIGICYLLEEEAAVVREQITRLCQDRRFDQSFWEEALYCRDRMIVQAKVVPAAEVIEINTYEQLRNLDGNSDQLKSDVILLLADVLGVTANDIVDIAVLKKGMTNRSFLFSCGGQKYIMRIPGEGTDQLINRKEEALVYQTIMGMGICDDVVYINPENGYKLTKFIDGVRCCNPDDVDDLKRCMAKLKEFHDRKLQVNHTFDIFEKIDFYESLWDGAPSAYGDYAVTKEHVLSLKPYIDAHVTEWSLTHIDAVPDNFLFAGDDIRLIDWEYAAMQDPHVDIAMFCIYSLYNREQVDRLIDIYFKGTCAKETRIKIYCYIAAAGLLWSNWCEYKRQLGVEFGEYSLRQYRFAKDYYKIVRQELEKGADGGDE